VTALGVGEAAQYAAGTTKFADVPADHWATGFINVAVDLGIINGYPDGTFAPENSVTYAEAIKMIVAALGYTPKAEAMGGYPGGYLAVAAEKEISDGVTVVGALAANRGDIALMIDNALTVPMMVQKTWGQYPEYAEDEDQTLMKKLGVKEIECRVVAIPRIDSKLDDNEIRIGEAEDSKDNGVYEVIEGVDVEAAFGNEVTIFVKKDKVLGITIESDFFLDAIKWNSSDKELELVEQDEEYDLAKDVVVYIDGDKKAVNNLGTKYEYAKVVLDDDGDVVFIDAYGWDGAILVEEVDDEVIYGYDDEMDLEDYTLLKDGKVVSVDVIEEGDVVFYEKSSKLAEVFTDTVVGVIDEVYTGKFRLAGKDYDIAGQYVNEDDELGTLDEAALEQYMDEGDDVTAYFNRAGDVVFMVGNLGVAETSKVKGILVAPSVKDTRRNVDYFTIDIVNTEGVYVEYDVKEGTEVAGFGAGVTVIENVNPTALVAGKGEDAVFVELTINDSGTVKKVTKLSVRTNSTDVKTTAKYMGNDRLTSGTVLFLTEDWDPSVAYDEDDNYIEVVKLGDAEFDYMKGATAKIGYATDSKGNVTLAAVDATDAEEDAEVYTAIVLSSNRVSGKDYNKVVLLIDGAERTVYTKDIHHIHPELPAGFNKIPARNDIATVKIDENADKLIEFTSFSKKNTLTTVGAVSTNNRSITFTDGVNPENDVTYYLLDDAYIYDWTGNNIAKAGIGLRDLDVDDTVWVYTEFNTNSLYVKYVFLKVDASEGVGTPDVDGEAEIDAPYLFELGVDKVNVKLDVAAGTFNDYILMVYEGEAFVKSFALTDAAETPAGVDIDISEDSVVAADKAYTLKVVEKATGDVLATKSIVTYQ